MGIESGYQWGYYLETRDQSTRYFFHQMAKGKHVVETEYYIDREGNYLSGTCTAQCAYAPEYSGRTTAATVVGLDGNAYSYAAANRQLGGRLSIIAKNFAADLETCRGSTSLAHRLEILSIDSSPGQRDAPLAPSS